MRCSVTIIVMITHSLAIHYSTNLNVRSLKHNDTMVEVSFQFTLCNTSTFAIRTFLKAATSRKVCNYYSHPGFHLHGRMGDRGSFSPPLPLPPLTPPPPPPPPPPPRLTFPEYFLRPKGRGKCLIEAGECSNCYTESLPYRIALYFRGTKFSRLSESNFFVE